MNPQLFAVSLLTFYTSLVKGGLISTYNLISPHQFISQPVLIPQSLSHNSVEFVHPHQTYSGFEPTGISLAHPQVLETAQEESLLPNALTKSRKFYSNPYVASALAEESINFKKEEVTFDRPSEKIDRREIAKLIHNLDRVHNEPHH